MINGVAFTAYAVRDVPRAAAFYRDVLGLGPENAFNAEYVEFDLGATCFALDASPPPGIAPGTCSGVAFETDDVAGARSRLLAGGADVSDVYEFPTCTVCFAKDPDGNAFTVHKKKPGA